MAANARTVFRIASDIASVAVVLLGVVVIAGWHLGMESLFRPLAGSRVMYYNTALLFTLSGLALLCSSRGRVRIGSGLAILMMALSIATIFEYAWGVDLRIDNLHRYAPKSLIKDSSVLESSRGRMALNTCVAFVFVGLGILFFHMRKRHVRGLIVSVFGALSLFAFGLTLNPASSVQPDLLELALHSTLAMTLLGIALITTALSEQNWKENPPSWAPSITGISVMALAIIVWHVLIAERELRAAIEVQRTAEEIAAALKDEMDLRAKALQNAFDDWTNRISSREEWAREAGLYFIMHPDCKALLWNRSNETWSVGDSSWMAMGGAMELPEAAVVAARMPVIHLRAVKPVSEMIAAVDPVRMIEREAGAWLRNYEFRINDDAGRLYGTAGQMETARMARIEHAGAHWTLRVWPKESNLALLRSNLPHGVLLLGLMLAALLAHITQLARASRVQAVQLGKANETLRIWVQESRNLEEQLQAARDSLESRVDQRTTELKSALQASRASDEQLRMAMQAGGAGIFDWNLVDDNWATSVEQDSASSWRKHPKDAENIVFAVEAATRQGKDTVEFEFRLIGPGGETRWLAGGGRFVYDDTGVPIRLIGVNVDITDAKRVAEALSNSEAEMRTIVDSLPVGIWFLNRDCKVVMANAAAHRIWGGPAGADLLAYEHCRGWRRDTGEMIKPHEWAASRVMKGERVNNEIVEIDSLDGSRKVIYNSAVAITDIDGELRGAVVINEEITERLMAEEAIKRNETRYRALANNLPQIIWTTSPDGAVSFINDRWFEYTGCDRQDAREIDVRAYLEPGDRENVIRQQSRAVREGSVFEAECRLKAADGNYRWQLGRAAPVRDSSGAIMEWVWSYTDTEDQKRSAQNKFAAILDSTGDCIAALDLDFRYMAFNRAYAHHFLRIYGKEPEVGAKITDLINHLPEEQASLVTIWGRALRGEEFTYIGEFGDVQRDRPTYEIKFNSIRDAAGRLVGAAHVLRDTTTRKQAEDRLQANAEELSKKNQELAENAQQLAESKARAEKATRAKSDFLAAMSHEIRTPMTAVLGMADLLWETQLNSEQREYLRICRKSGHNLLAVINDILDLSKVEAGRLSLDHIDFDLRAVVDKTGELMAQRAHEKNIELICHVAPDVPEDLIGDPDRLQQILCNLVSNAVKFTEKGQVMLQVETDPDDLRPGCFRFCVSDTGIGIPRESLQRIFERFVQADSSISRKYGGTGLGLPICQHLVQLMQGRIWVESELGRGSKFYFTAKFGVQPGAKAKTPVASVTLDGRRVLIVDDNDTNRLILRQELHRFGIVPGEAENGWQALTEVKRALQENEPYDVLLVDCHMPGIDGFELIEMSRKLVVTGSMPAVMLTSDNRSGDITRARDLQVAGYLLKPVKRDDLLEAISAALEGRSVASPAARATVEAATTASRPLRILLVEDSPDNVFLFQEYLRDTGHLVDHAEDGLVAIEKCTRGAYDIVLMDVHMPQLDGYAATRRIRQWERENGRPHTPIVALTAHALKQEEEKSFEAGCDGHLTKPIQRHQLVEAIGKFSKLRAPEAAPISVNERVRKLLPKYIERRHQDLQKLHEALSSHDYEAARTIGHNLKGSGRGYGIPEFSEIGARLEQAANLHEDSALQIEVMAFESALKTRQSSLRPN